MCVCVCVCVCVYIYVCMYRQTNRNSYEQIYIWEAWQRPILQEYVCYTNHSEWFIIKYRIHILMNISYYLVLV